MRHKCKIGVMMLAVWLLSRFSLTTLSTVNRILDYAVVSNDSFYLVMAATLVVMSNAVRAVLLYCGWFLLAEGIADKTNRHFLEWVIPPVMIPISYQATVYFHLPSIPQFGFSAFFTLLSVLYLQYICRDVSKSGYKMLIQIMIVLAIQWLDVIPALSRWGLGMGELRLSVKDLASLLGKDKMVSTICLIFFFFNAVVALLMARLFVSYEKQLSQMNLIQTRERDLAQLRHQQASARLYQELQLLVHDLKRPLTAIVGLANLLSLSKDREVLGHGEIILEAAEGMDQMINEIRTPQAVRCVKTGELIDYTMSQVRPLPWGENVVVEVSEVVRSKTVEVNLIRFSRALVNLLDNARHASGLREDGVSYVKLSAETAGGDVHINIEDNGPGFTLEKRELSSWGSTGLGLVFVKQVIEDANCSIKYAARREGGTVCMVKVAAKREGEM